MNGSLVGRFGTTRSLAALDVFDGIVRNLDYSIASRELKFWRFRVGAAGSFTQSRKGRKESRVIYLEVDTTEITDEFRS